MLSLNYCFSQWNNNLIDTITNDSHPDFIPETSKLMAIDNTNTLHIVWQKRESPNSWEGTRTYYCKKINNIYWTDPIAISDTLKSSWSPGIVVNKNTGKVYIAYYTFYYNGSKQISDIVITTNETGVWKKNIITNGNSNEVTPNIAIGNNSKVHIAWTGLDSLGNWKIKYCNNAMGYWNTQTLSESQLGNFGSGAYPNLSLEHDGTAHIFYRGDEGHTDIYHAENNFYAGTQWHYEQVTYFNWYTCYGLSQISNKDDIYLVTTGSNDFQAKNLNYYITRKNGATKWSLPQLITNGDGTINSFILDENNKSHISWTETSYWFSTGNVYYANNKDIWRFYLLPIDTLYYGANLFMDNKNFGHLIYTRGQYPETNYEIYHIESSKNIVNINSENAFIPSTFVLYQNFPNPFNNQTIIKYILQARGYVMLKLFNISGAEVMTIDKGLKEPGTHEITIDVSKLTSGVYFFKLENDFYSDTKKLLLIK